MHMPPKKGMEDIVVAIEIKFAQMSTHTCALQFKTKTAKRWTVNLANEQNGIILPPTIKVVRFFVFSCKEISNLHFETSLARHFSTEMVSQPKRPFAICLISRSFVLLRLTYSSEQLLFINTCQFCLPPLRAGCLISVVDSQFSHFSLLTSKGFGD